MKTHRILLSLSTTLFILAGIVSPAQAKCTTHPTQEYTINQMEELTTMLENSSQTLCDQVKCRMPREIRKQLKQLINYQGVFHYCKHFAYEDHGTSLIYLMLGYRDSIRMQAIDNHPELTNRLSAKQKQAFDIAKEIIDRLIKPEMSDEEKILALHDEVINTSSYTRNKDEATDILLNHQGCCEAYANTMQLLMTLAGLPNRMVLGIAKGGTHAWNLVQINGTWYHIDTTWDDPIIRGGKKQLLLHTYFLLNDQQMAYDHNWKQDDLPLCNGKEYPYFQKRGLYFTSYPQFWEAASAALAQGEQKFEAYLAPYSSKSQFLVSFYVAQANHPNLSALCAWKAPATPKGGVIHLEFDTSGTATQIVEETEESW